METKKKSKAPIIVVIILLLIAAGFCYWKFVYQVEQLAQYELTENADVETKLVAETNWHEDEMDNYREMFDAMAEVDASYFIVESLDIWSDDYFTPRFKLYQTNKDEFSEQSVMSPEKAIKEVNEGISRFLNYSHNSLPGSLYGNINNNGIFGKLDVSSEAQGYIDPQFGGSVAEYFQSHKLELKCDDCKVEQIGIEINPDGSIYYNYNIIANVLTENCIGDMNELGIFANQGKTKTVNINIRCIYDDNSKELFVDFMLIE